MEKELFDIDQLISNRFLGTITPDNDQLLDKWIGEKIENQRYFSEQKKLWELFTMHQKMQQIDEYKAFQKISAQLFTRKKRNILAYIQRIAAIMLIPVVIASSIYILSEKTERKQQATVYNTAETPLGMRSSLVLPDGTKVWLNAGSKLRYPVLFSEKYRAVELCGEAYFEVKKDKKWPFVVTSGNMNIVVSGTTFNCNAYDENNQIETVLVEGQVTVINESATISKELLPNELAIFSKNNQQIVKSKINPEKYIAWKSGKLMFRDDKMDLVVEKLERWYNVEFEIKDKEITNYIYTATFIDESLDQVLKMLSLSAPIRYSVSERSKLGDQTFEKQTVKLYKK
ncbi:MAG TPA: iron dicitrate transport regulator FecR [Prolixibacteraceae bacterium]|nr:iron dicitrate transport regulator FecR [Prolixibacteraceae bacterium]